MIITLLTDYGHDDDFVGVCHGVIRSISPDTPIVDITHGIPRHDVRQGALVLLNTLPYMPVGVHVAVVDPEVGAGRSRCAARMEGCCWGPTTACCRSPGSVRAGWTWRWT